VQVIGFEGASRAQWRRPVLTTLFGLTLLGLFILTLYAPVVRSFFDFVPLGVDEWSIVIPFVLLAMAGQYVISHYWRNIIAWIIKQPEEQELTRGRAA